MPAPVSQPAAADHLADPILLPGGRWIIGISGAGSAWFISCWDLEACSIEDPRLATAASHELKSYSDVWDTCPYIQKYEYHPQDLAFSILVHKTSTPFREYVDL